MNAHRMDQETVERLLVGSAADAQDGPEVLVRLLAAVRADPRPHELAGEGAALLAFRTARAGSAPAGAPRPPRRLLTGLLSAKITLAALLAAATGGVALAAVTGALPGPLGGDEAAPTPSTGIGGHPSATVGPDASATAGTSPTDHPGGTTSLIRLCTAYRSEGEGSRQKALQSPRFATLVSAAGGRERVDDYCARLLGGPENPGGPSAEPTRRAGTEPTGRATARPERTPSAPGTPAGTAAPPTTRPPGSSVNLPASVGPSPR